MMSNKQEIKSEFLPEFFRNVFRRNDDEKYEISTADKASEWSKGRERERFLT